MIVAGGEQTDAIVGAGGQHRMGQRDLAMVQYDYRDVFERNVRLGPVR